MFVLTIIFWAIVINYFHKRAREVKELKYVMSREILDLRRVAFNQRQQLDRLNKYLGFDDKE